MQQQEHLGARHKNNEAAWRASGRDRASAQRSKSENGLAKLKLPQFRQKISLDPNFEHRIYSDIDTAMFEL
jgi:hypothetical protein